MSPGGFFYFSRTHRTVTRFTPPQVQVRSVRSQSPGAVAVMPGPSMEEAMRQGRNARRNSKSEKPVRHREMKNPLLTREVPANTRGGRKNCRAARIRIEKRAGQV